MYCQTPNIIVRKDLYKILSSPRRRMVFTNGVNIIPLGSGIPSAKSVGATYENYKNWNVLTEDGELIPIFQPVTCGKCVLCRNKKSKEWTTRARAETASAKYPPLFVTLTYSGDYLPEKGVEKKHVQNFLKRFREYWFRQYGERLDLRYFACAEYGSKYGRPHYHLQLWNVPNDADDTSIKLLRIREIIDRAWSTPVSFDEWKELLPMHQLILNKRYYRKFGRTEVTCDRGNSSSYCMKYMRKPQVVPPRWQNEPFYLSSRRSGGIGMRYLNQLIDDIRVKDPAITKILIRGDQTVYSLPRVFKEKLFPSLSLLIPPHIRYMLCRFDKLSSDLEHHDDKMIYFLRNSLRDHFGSAYDFIISSERFFHNPTELILTGSYDTMMYCYQICIHYECDSSKLDFLLDLKRRRQEILSKMSFPEISIKEECARILRKQRLSSLKEKF